VTAIVLILLNNAYDQSQKEMRRGLEAPARQKVARTKLLQPEDLTAGWCSVTRQGSARQVVVKYDPVRVAEGLTHQLIGPKKYAAGVRCPTAFIRGTRSAEMTPEAAKEVAKLWTKTEVDIYSVEARTSLQLENPKDLAAAINAFAAKRL
jgi:pimeloyl-ACP methyl ester carboxylesterase